MEGVGDHQGRDQHGQHTEAHQELGDDIGPVAKRFEILFAGLLLRHQREMLRQQPVDGIEGFRRDFVAVLGQVEVDRHRVDGVEIVGPLHQREKIVGSHDRAAVVRVGAVGIGGDADHAHLFGFGFVAVAGRGGAGRDVDGVSDMRVELRGKRFRQRHLIRILWLVALRDGDRQHGLVFRGGDEFATDVLAVFGHVHAGFRGDAHAVDAFGAAQLVDVEIPDRRGVCRVEFLVVQRG